MADVILTAQTIITMDEKNPRADAVAVSDGKIVAVGSLDACKEALPGADVRDTGAGALLPGFIESHSHPVLTGVSTMAPAVSIAPWTCRTWDDVVAVIKKTMAESDDKPMIFNGFDALLHERPKPTIADLDPIFGDRVGVLIDNSGHGAYFTSALIKKNGWDVKPPADPPASEFGRHADGSLNGQAFEIGALMMVAAPVMTEIGGNPLVSAMEYYCTLAQAGITSTTEHTYSPDLLKAYIALGSMPNNPLRVSLYHVSTDPNCADPIESPLPDELLIKQGIKLWADGSPWVGNIAISFPYLDTQATRNAGIDGSMAGEAGLNYSRAQLDALLDKFGDSGLQMAFHVNGDMGLDLVLDSYERALSKFNLLGTDHGWRVEHVGAGRKDQFARAAGLGVRISMGPFQLQYWGDLLDGQMFDSEYGSQWQAFRDAFDSGAPVSFHNDGSVSPASPIHNIKTAVTRTTTSGTAHGLNQAVSVDEALKAETIYAAMLIKREHLVGSIQVGKLADFVELSTDPYTVDPHALDTSVAVQGTWLGGHRIDLAAFMANATKMTPEQHAEHAHLHQAAHKHPHRC